MFLHRLQSRRRQRAALEWSACVRVQSVWRGHAVRCCSDDGRRVSAAVCAWRANRENRPAGGAPSLAQQARGHARSHSYSHSRVPSQTTSDAHTYSPVVLLAVTKLQAGVRKTLACAAYAHLRGRAGAVKHRAAVQLAQRVARGWLARRRAAMHAVVFRHVCACLIQRQWRCHVARGALAVLRTRWLHRRQAAAAMAVQRVWRGYQVRRGK